MRSKLIFGIVLLVIVVGYSSCCNECEKGTLEDGSLFGAIMKTDSNFLRGIDLRDSLQQVRSYYKESPRQQENDYLYYRFYLNKKELVNTTFNFKDNQLYELRLEMKLISKNRLADLKQQFNDYFDKKYGKSEEDDDGFQIWKTSTIRSKDIEISLKDESSEKRNLLRVSFYDYEL